VLTSASHSTLPLAAWAAIAAAGVVLAILIGIVIGRRLGRRALSQRLTALGSRLGIDQPEETKSIEEALSYLEQVTGAATEAVAESSADAIRLRRSLDTMPQGVVICDENGKVVYRNARANALMTSRRGDALAAQAVTELLEDAWDQGAAERSLDLYGPPRRTLTVRARLIDDGRRPLGVIAMIEDVSERRRLEEIRRDFVANVSHELKTPMGALGLLAETLVSEPDMEVAQRLASRIHTEAFRVSRIIDDLLDLSRIESEEAPPREPVLVNLVMAEAIERVRATADQRRISIALIEPDPPVAVVGDRRQLVSAMHALLENAVTYSYENTTVTVAGVVGQDAGGAAAAHASGSLTHATASSISYATTAVPSYAGVGLGGGGQGLGPAPGGGGADDAFGLGAEGTNGGGDGRGWGGDAARSGPADGGPSAQHDLPEGTGDDTGPPTDQRSPTPGATTAPASPASTIGSTTSSTEDSGALSGRADLPPHLADGSTRPGREVVRLSVADHGSGIPARDLDRIFERFYRVDHGRSRDTGGTGLGLSIVRHVANNHQGWVDVESREGEGSTFTLVLPLQSDRGI
jgi:two-component system, OmpR family, sensor histidine kinase SenX3